MAWPIKSATALRENAPPGRFLILARLLRRRTKAKGWTTYGLPPSLKNIPLEYFLRYARKSRTGRSPRARTPAAYFKARSRPFVTPFSFLSDIHFSRRQGGNVRAPHGGSELSGASRLCWDYVVNANFIGTDCEPSKDVRAVRALSTRQYDLLLRCRFTRPGYPYCPIIQNSLIK